MFLLRRNNWARLAVIAILTLGIVWSVGSLGLQFELFSGMPSSFPSQETQRMFTVMRFAAAVFEIGVAVLLAWLIWRLLSPAISAEFRAP